MNKKYLEKLYFSGKSMTQIAKMSNSSANKIVYWMRKYDIKRRSRSEANYVLYNPDGDPFKIKETLSNEELLLKGLALGIYWGEGTKLSKHSLRVANTNPQILRAFREFLKKICQLDDKRITYNIVSFKGNTGQKS